MIRIDGMSGVNNNITHLNKKNTQAGVSRLASNVVDSFEELSSAISQTNRKKSAKENELQRLSEKTIPQQHINDRIQQVEEGIEAFCQSKQDEALVNMVKDMVKKDLAGGKISIKDMQDAIDKHDNHVLGFLLYEYAAMAMLNQPKTDIRAVEQIFSSQGKILQDSPSKIISALNIANELSNVDKASRSALSQVYYDSIQGYNSCLDAYNAIKKNMPSNIRKNEQIIFFDKSLDFMHSILKKEIRKEDIIPISAIDNEMLLHIQKDIYTLSVIRNLGHQINENIA